MNNAMILPLAKISSSAPVQAKAAALRPTYWSVNQKNAFVVSVDGEVVAVASLDGASFEVKAKEGHRDCIASLVAAVVADAEKNDTKLHVVSPSSAFEAALIECGFTKKGLVFTK